MFRRLVRNISACAVVVLCLTAFSVCESVGQLKPTGFVNDFAHVLDAESVRQMEYLCTEIEQKTQAQVSVVTINSLSGVTIESFAHRLFRQWGIGPKSSNRGILILLAVGDRKYRIEVGTGLEAIVTDRKAAGFGREAVPYLKQMQYGTALRMITGRVADALAADAHVTIADAPPPTPTPAPARSSSSGNGEFFTAILTMVVVIAIIALILYVVGSSISSGPYYRRPVYTSYYGYPGGGYIHTTNNYYGGFGSAVNVSSDAPPDSGWSGGGGFGGGGGFSGFGGGSSSGAGASGDYSDSGSSSSSSSDDSGSSGSWSSSDSSSSDSSSSDSGSSDSGGDSGGGDSGGGASGDY